MWADKVDAAIENAKQVVTKAHTVFVTEQIGPARTEPPGKLGVTYMLRELTSKAQARPTLYDDLPEQCFVRDPATQQLVPAASYAPPRVPCMREYKYADVMAMIRYTCAATTEDCQAAMGTAFDRRPDCESWCTGQAEPKAVLASYLPDKHVLACYQQQCNDEFADLSFRPKLNEEACALGCANELCAGEHGRLRDTDRKRAGPALRRLQGGPDQGLLRSRADTGGVPARQEVRGRRLPLLEPARGRVADDPAHHLRRRAKLDGPKLDAGAGSDAPRTDAGAGDAPQDGRRGHHHQGVQRAVRDPGGRHAQAFQAVRQLFRRVQRIRARCATRSPVSPGAGTRPRWCSGVTSRSATAACDKVGMRVPTLTELRSVVRVACAEAVHWGKGNYMTRTDHPDPEPQWLWCVSYPDGKEDLCINYVGMVCVK